MATGWANEGAVQEQIDATVRDGIRRAQRLLPQGPGRGDCEECGSLIPEGRRRVLPGVRFCVACQESLDRIQSATSTFNRRGSKDSQLR